MPVGHAVEGLLHRLRVARRGGCGAALDACDRPDGVRAGRGVGGLRQRTQGRKRGGIAEFAEPPDRHEALHVAERIPRGECPHDAHGAFGHLRIFRAGERAHLREDARPQGEQGLFGRLPFAEFRSAEAGELRGGVRAGRGVCGFEQIRGGHVDPPRLPEKIAVQVVDGVAASLGQHDHRGREKHQDHEEGGNANHGLLLPRTAAREKCKERSCSDHRNTVA